MGLGDRFARGFAGLNVLGRLEGSGGGSMAVLPLPEGDSAIEVAELLRYGVVRSMLAVRRMVVSVVLRV